METTAKINAIGLYESSARLCKDDMESAAELFVMAAYSTKATHQDWTAVCAFAPLTDFKPGGWKTRVDDADLDEVDYDKAREQTPIDLSRPEGGATWELELTPITSDGCEKIFESGLKNVRHCIHGTRGSLDITKYYGDHASGVDAVGLDMACVEAMVAPKLVFNPRRDRRGRGPVILLHAIDVPRGFKSTNVSACFVDGPFVDFGYVDVERAVGGVDESASTITIRVRPCTRCERRIDDPVCHCRPALLHLTGPQRSTLPRLGCHQFMDWSKLPSGIRANIAHSRPPALWCKDVLWDGRARRRFPSADWHITMAGVMTRERELTPWGQRSLQCQGYDTTGSLDARQVPASEFMGPPPDEPFTYRIGYIDRSIFPEPMFLVLFPRMIGIREKGNDMTKQQRKSIRKLFHNAQDFNIVDGTINWISNYMTVRMHEMRAVGLQGNDDDFRCNMPDDLVLHVLGQLNSNPPHYHSNHLWGRGHYPTIVVGLASVASGKRLAVPVYTHDGQTVRQRMARVFVDSDSRGYRIYVRFEACLECNVFPVNYAIGSRTKTCECDDLRNMPHMGPAGVGHCVTMSGTVMLMSVMPVAVRDAVSTWRATFGTLSYDEWYHRRNDQRIGMARLPLFGPPQGIARNRVRALDPEMRDFWASRCVVRLEAGMPGWIPDDQKFAFTPVEEGDVIFMGARSHEMKLLTDAGLGDFDLSDAMSVDEHTDTSEDELEQL